MDKLISTIIPVYNSERFLREALDSLLVQSWKNHEIIAVDDGSPDGSAAIMKEYEGRIKIITQENRGIAGARNTGISHAQGDFIAFIDADDVWAPNKLERQMHYFAAQPETEILTTHIRHHLQEGAEKPTWLKPEFLERDVPGYLPSSMLVRRICFEKVGLFNSAYTLTDDGKWLFDARDMGLKIAVLPETLVTRRIHGANNSGNVPKLHSELLKIAGGSIARKRRA